MKGLEVWNAVKKYLNLYHHQAVKENIDVETVEGMPINIIEKELKALEILKCFLYIDENDTLRLKNGENLNLVGIIFVEQNTIDLLKEVLL